MTTLQIALKTAPETAPETESKPWWVEKYLCSTVDVKDAKPGQQKRVASIYRAIGIESGRIVGRHTLLDGSLTDVNQPLRFFPIESLISSTYDNKPGTRVFDSYAAAARYAESVGAKTLEDMLGLTEERLTQIKSDVKGGKTNFLKFVTATE